MNRKTLWVTAALLFQAVHALSDEGGGRSAGPDVIVGDIANELSEPFGVRRIGRVGDITAYSVGTVHCNPGSAPVNWIASTNEHPVIGLNLYRLKNGRFEQIGMSWLMHTYGALSQSVCFSDCQSDLEGDALGVHCSNPHSSQPGWAQVNLGPRQDVNAATGHFPYPWSAPEYPATVGRRLQVRDADLHPPANPGALYFIEVHDVTADDALAGNAVNNASYRRVQVLWSGGTSTTYNLDFVPGHATRRESPALLAWREVDAEVRIEQVDIAVDGRLSLGSRAMDLGGGWWHYEYALHNLNSDRSAGSFNIPIPRGTSVANLGFHDIDYHSYGADNGSFYDGTDWSGVVSPACVSWATTPFEDDEIANAVRWGTTYNFRFDADRPPGEVQAGIGLFKPGMPGSVNAAAVGPVAFPAVITRAVSRQTCDLELLPGLTSEPRQGGITEVRITFDAPPGCPAESNPVEICETVCAAGPPAPYTGVSEVTCEAVGHDLVLNFTPALENARSYRITLGPQVTSVPGQHFNIRALVGDVNSDGRVDAIDRSLVVAAWSGAGFTCATDLNSSGLTDALDRSLVVGAWTDAENCAPTPQPCAGD